MLAQYTDDKGISLGGLFDNFKVNVDSYKKVIDDFKKIESFDDFIDPNGKANWDAIAEAIKDCDETIISYFQTLDDGNGTIDNQSASVEGLSEYLHDVGESFDFAAIKTSLFNSALNAGIMLLASLVIQGIVTALDNYIHRVEKARERTDKLFDEFNQMNDTLSDHKKTVSDLADRYDELSKGVDLLNNKNVSLSTEEYEEFLNINEQLAKAFPELAKGIDENGNSILTLGTKGITAKEQLEELLKTEEDLNNFRIAQGLEETFKGVYTYVEDANKATETLNGSINDSSEAMSRIQDIAENGIKLTDNGQFIFGGDIHNEAELNYMNSLTDSVNKFWKSLDGSRRVELAGFGIDSSTLFRTDLNYDTGVFKIYADTYQLTPEELTALESIIRDNVGDASSALLDSISDRSQELQEQIKKSENAWTDFIPTLVSGMKSKHTFKNLDTDLQDIAIQIVEGLDYSYADAMKEWDPDPYAYVRDKIIDPLSKLDDSGKEKLTSSFEELFKLDADDLSQSNQEEIEKFITTIATLLEKDPIEIRVALGFDVEEAQNRYNEALKEAKRQLGGYGHDDRGFEVNNATGNKIDDFWNENVVTEEDWTLWQKVTDGITDATEAMNAYTEAKKNANGVELNDNSFIPTISSSVQQLATQLEPQFAKLGEAYKAIFTDDGFTLNDVDNSMLEGLRKSFAEIEEEIGVTFDSSKLEPFFDALTSDYDTAEKGAEKVQQAFNDLATSYFYNTETLGQLNDETADAIEKQLEEMGVANAEEIVMQALAEAKARAFLASYDLADATDADITAMLNEAESAGIATDMIFKLVAEEQVFNAQGLSTEGKVAQLKELATAYGQTAVAAKIARMEDEYTKSHQAINYEEIAKAAHAEINGAINSVHVDFKGVGGGKKSGSGSGSSAKSTAEEFDWIEQAIENVEKEIKSLDETANSAYSTFSEKNEALTKEIGKVTEEIELQQKAYEEYMRKADSIPLSEKYKELVRNGEINIEAINNNNLRQKISEYQKWYEKAQNVSDAIKQLKTDIKDLHVESYKLQTDNLKDRLDSNSITEKQYLDGLKDAYERFYADLEDFAQQYHEAKLHYLDKEKDYLNNVASAATSLIDREINNIRDDAKEQENRIKRQIELLEDKKKPLQDELDALEEKARRENLILNLQKAQYARAKAENQRNKLVYTSDRGMIYTNDSEAIRDAKRDVDDAKLEIQKQSIQDQINAIDKEIDRYNDLIDQINKAADAQIDALERIKNKWQEAIDVQKYAENVSLLTGEFGDNAIEKILSGNDDDLLAQWKNSYITTLAEIDKESQGYIGNMTQQMASLYGIDLSPLQNQFQGVKESVDVVTEALGATAEAIGASTSRNNDTTKKSAQRDVGNNKGTSLESAIQNETQTAIDAFNQHTDKITNEVIPAIHSATDEMNAFNAAADVDIEKTITIHYETTGNPGGVSGNAHVEGTAKVNGDWEVQSNEKHALVGEIGRELIVRNGKYFTVGDNGAEMFKIQKGDIVFNHEQTEALLKNGHISGHGKAYADGTVGGGKVITADGTILYPLQPGDRAWEVQKAFEPFINKIISGEMELVNTAMFEHQKQMEEMAKQISYVSSITNNNRNVQQPIHNEIHVTLPNVTNATSAESLLRDLESIGRKKYQVNW